jgi:hypothetical protein
MEHHSWMGSFCNCIYHIFINHRTQFQFWDCGEYISSAVKFEVTHAPGAALFQLVGAVVALFAFGDGQHYSLVINAMSALFSAFTILVFILDDYPSCKKITQ